MATPVGPVARDPNDPDRWEEWDDPDGDDDELDAASGYGPAVRLVALLIVVAFTLLIVVAR
ncbi:MAG: hypothetical protein QOD01_802 [Actinomycetota bacterium]|nr:hypothetical protein [Actinomycetota bacterium]